MQKIRPDMDIGKNIQAIRYKNQHDSRPSSCKIKSYGYLHHQKYLCQLETNRMNIKVSELVALAKIFHTDINAFFSDLL